MRKEKISINLVSIISLLIIISSVFCISGFIYYRHQKELKLAELNSNLKTTIDQLSKSISVAVWNFDEEQAIGILESGMLDKNINEIIIEYNDKNKTVFSIVRDENQALKIYKEKILWPSDCLLLQKDILHSDEKIGKLTLCATTGFVKQKLKEGV